jgi:hypothetical protein
VVNKGSRDKLFLFYIPRCYSLRQDQLIPSKAFVCSPCPAPASYANIPVAALPVASRDVRFMVLARLTSPMGCMFRPLPQMITRPDCGLRLNIYLLNHLGGMFRPAKEKEKALCLRFMLELQDSSKKGHACPHSCNADDLAGHATFPLLFSLYLLLLALLLVLLLV